MRLVELAKVIRSKNAGPLQVTLDVMFPDLPSYRRAAESAGLHERIAAAFGIATGDVVMIRYQAALAIKLVIDRPVVAGSPGDTDVYGAQQHGPLLQVEV